MKKVILFVLIGINVPVNAQQLPSEAKDVIKAIYTEALGTQQGYKWLHHICTKIGPRSSGSDAANQAAIYTKQMMLNAGADTAWLQPVEVPKWYRGEEWSKAYTRGDTLSLPTTALGGSVPTPKEGIKAAVVEVGSFEELEKLGKEGIEGKIVFYNTYMDHSLISTFNAYGGAV